MDVSSFSVPLQAAFWGFVGGSALVLGAAVGYFARLPQRLVAGVMAFGAGVLIAALSFELMEEAYERGGFDSTALGFLGGAALFTLANVALTRSGGAHRKRSGEGEERQQTAEEGSGLALAAGALLDGVPESLVIGLGLLGGGGVSFVAVAAVFLSNVPEGLSSAAGMRRAGRSPAYVFGVWGAIALASGVAAWAGASLFAGAGAETVAFVNALAAGAILAMVADTMIPEAFETSHEFAGLISAAGFLAAFVLTKLEG